MSKALSRVLVLTTSTVLLLAIGAAPASAETRSFACETPRFVGSGECGAPFTVASNDIVRVNLVSSGGKKVLFSGYVDGDYIGDTGYLHPGAAEKYLWQNTSGHAVTMQMYAKSDSETYVAVLAQGNYRIEP